MSGLGRWVRIREVKDSLGVSVCPARSAIVSVLGFVGGSWVWVLLGVDMGGGVGGRCIRSGSRGGILSGDTSVELGLLLISVVLLVILSMALSVVESAVKAYVLSLLVNVLPFSFAAVVWPFPKEVRTEENDFSVLLLLLGEICLGVGVSDRTDEDSTLGVGEMTPSVSS